MLSRDEAVRELFSRDLSRNLGGSREYSTRMKAHALADLGGGQVSGPEVWGYRSASDSLVQTYRVFVPDSTSSYSGGRANALVFVMHGLYNKTSDFWNSYEGTSHALMAKRAALSTESQEVLVMPHGRGIENYLGDALDELPSICGQLFHSLAIDTTRCAILVWSGGARSVLELLQSVRIPLVAVGLVSPVLPPNVTEMQRMLSRIRHLHPGLKWFIWHGMDDTDAPIHVTRRWVDRVRSTFSEVHYQEVPHASHWNYPVDPEREFYRLISGTGN
jgi:predicted esterase